MKRLFTGFAIILICAGFFSCFSSPASVQAGSSVWKVSRGGNTLFMGGSVHVLRAEDLPLPGEFDRAFSLSSALVLEADIEQLADESVVRYLTAHMFLPGSVTLETLLDSEAYGMLNAKCEEYGFSIKDTVSRLKPSMIMNMLAMLEIQQHGFVQQGVDEHYLKMAKEAGKPLDFLETVQAQIDMISTMGDGYENDFVKYSLYDMDSTENELAAIVTEWKKGGSATTERALLEMREQWPLIYKTLIIDRNTAWMPKINGYLNAGSPVFIITGLAHMYGPDGLLKKLADAGCTIERF
jgi:uncharacterized protein YbaP (TraB family)